MPQSARKSSKTFLKFLKGTLGVYLKHKFNVSAEGAEILGLKPPFVLLGNHTNFWDPFLLSYYVPEPVYYVASDEYFRNPLLKFLLHLVGAIPKSKFVSDQAAVMDILRVKRNGGVIGIFPEGKRNWDGRTDELLFPTAKLIKHLKVPVVTALLQGAYLSFPRWARSPRKGRIAIRFTAALSTEELAKMSVEEIHAALKCRLTYSDHDFQQKVQVLFKGPRLAENLELYLFICPKCHTFSTLSSEGNEFTCRSCGYTVIYGEDGHLTAKEGDTCFSTPGEWGDWQQAYLAGILDGHAGGNIGEPFLADDKVTLKRGRRLIPLKKINFGHIRLFSDRLEFTSHLKQQTCFFLAKISGLNVQHNNQFEFYYDDLLYRFSFRSARISAYKWVLAIRLLKEQNGKKVLTD